MAIRIEDVAGTDFSDVATTEHIGPVTPGDVLRDDFLVPLGLSARALARELNVPSNRISAIVAGERGVTAETAILLGQRFGTSAEFWMNLQTAHDLEEARRHTPAAHPTTSRGTR
jgi:antitoxin HigA-1